MGAYLTSIFILKCEWNAVEPRPPANMACEINILHANAKNLPAGVVFRPCQSLQKKITPIGLRFQLVMESASLTVWLNRCSFALCLRVTISLSPLRHSGGPPAALLWDGAGRAVLWGHAGGGVCERAAAHRVQQVERWRGESESGASHECQHLRHCEDMIYQGNIVLIARNLQEESEERILVIYTKAVIQF